MKYRRRVFFTDKQKSEIWDRCQRGESMSSIGRGFDRGSSSIYPFLPALAAFVHPKAFSVKPPFDQSAANDRSEPLLTIPQTIASRHKRLKA
jgi:hypothetical protein